MTANSSGKLPPVGVRWLGEDRFLGDDALGHTLVFDTPREAGGQGRGFIPSRLLLLALAGCAGQLVTIILRRMRQAVTAVTVEVEGDFVETEEAHYYRSIQLTYQITGVGLKPRMVERAIEFAEGTYCSVSQTLRRSPAITSRYVLGEPTATPNVR